MSMEGAGNGEDRISYLDDDLLHKILSFLDTKYAVQTCVLSKRWKFLWRTLPYLHFNMFTYFPVQDSQDEDALDASMGINLTNLITQVLCRFPHQQFGFLVGGLICYAIQHNVQQLSVRSYSNAPILLPESLFTCQSLTALELVMESVPDAHFFLRLPKFMANFLALKSLHLHGFSMMGPNVDPVLFSGCPNLETLELLDILVDEHKNLCVNALNLKYLQLSLLGSGEIYRCKLVIDAPKLTSFKYRGYTPIVCSKDNLPSLDDANFYIYKTDLKEEKYALQIINSCKEFRNVKSLTLSSSIVKVLSMFPSLLRLDENQVLYANLKYLKITGKKFEIPANVKNYFLNGSTILKIC
ncbi:hypothetical protein PTKIN_Ptkin01aG0260600 [Pterospermum kingtungense]